MKERIVLVAIVLASITLGYFIGGARVAKEFDAKYRALVNEYQGFLGEG